VSILPESRPAAVLFDFGQTLFHRESEADWAHSVLKEFNMDLSADHITQLLTQVRSAARTPSIQERLQIRYRSPDAHREANTACFEAAGLPSDLVAALYDRMVAKEAWTPFPDAYAVLAALKRQSVPVGVISNIGWDIRVHFEYHDLLSLVDSFTLSCELGIEKPDARIFHKACQALGSDPESTLMVGDDPLRDGPGVYAGLQVYLLPRTADDGPRGLGAVLALTGNIKSHADM
jgi:FMN phosphatase YigB (HAD superfamily)